MTRVPPQNRTKMVKFRFYRVVTPDSGSRFADFLNAIFALQGPDRSEVADQSCYRLQQLETSMANWIVGRFTRLRLDAEPAYGSVDGDETEISLRDDEGLRENAFFLFDPALRILVFQQNRLVADEHKFAWYIERKAEGKPKVEILPVLPGDVVLKLRRADIVKHIDASFASPQVGDFYRGDNESLTSAATILGGTGAGSLQMVLRARRNRSLTLGAVLAFVQSTLRVRGDNTKKVRRLKVGVEYPDGGGGELLDLIDAVMEAEIPVSYNRRQYVPPEVFDTLSRAYVEQAAGLEEMFSKE